jgi:hypothetical protein
LGGLRRWNSGQSYVKPQIAGADTSKVMASAEVKRVYAAYIRPSAMSLDP